MRCDAMRCEAKRFQHEHQPDSPPAFFRWKFVHHKSRRARSFCWISLDIGAGEINLKIETSTMLLIKQNI